MTARSIARPLLAWYDRHRRPLPWRADRDPYRVWLSEIMLQQTRIEVVRGYYERFLARFATVEALAQAPEQEVLRYWAGLGYYSRARNLHRAARTLVDEHEGQFPRTVEGLRALAGVGRYTAGAIASIAFDVPAPVLDGNVSRVLARLQCVPGDPRSTEASARLWALAGDLVPARRPGDYNQALMELGEVVCTPRAPACPRCPLRQQCEAHARGRVGEFPGVRVKRARPEVSAVCGAIERDGEVLFVRRAPRGLLGGMWELPGSELPGSELPGSKAAAHVVPSDALAAALAARVGLRVKVVEPLGTVRHVFTHRALTLSVFWCASAKGRVRLEPGYVEHAWVRPSDARERLALPSVTRKALATLEERDGAAHR